MRVLNVAFGVAVLVFLQACSSQPAQTGKTSSIPGQSIPGQVGAADDRLTNKTGFSVASQQQPDYSNDTFDSVPELQIIRELYQSGCQIQEMELNRRNQNMRVSCVDNRAF
ncbi:MAG: hypothetical protein KAU21_11805 [Gammaproteobacteria bacterium]|nr:hypothetical protein [Gammaproteobacteria bacterium]